MAPYSRKSKPPNGFSWYARHLADQRKQAGRPFRSIKAAIHEAGKIWPNLTLEQKLEWKQKAKTEFYRFIEAGSLKGTTPHDFIGQVCDLPDQGTTGTPRFWTRHWDMYERERYAEELDFMKNFDFMKRKKDRETMYQRFNWNYHDNIQKLMDHVFLLISVQSSLPIETDEYVPETMAIAEFTLNQGIIQYSDFCCALAEDGSGSGRRSAGNLENFATGEGCNTKTSLSTVSKLVFQKVKGDPAKTVLPMFYCLSEEFEMVYDLLSSLKYRQPPKSQGDSRRLSVHAVATIEDLTYALFEFKGIKLPPTIGDGPLQQQHMHFDTLMECGDMDTVAGLRCGAHERDSLTRCPLSVVRLAAGKMKTWLDNGGIPRPDWSLLERKLVCEHDWPFCPEHDYVEAYEDGQPENVEPRGPNKDYVVALNKTSGKELVLAWLEGQPQPTNSMEVSESTQPTLPVAAEFSQPKDSLVNITESPQSKNSVEIPPVPQPTEIPELVQPKISAENGEGSHQPKNSVENPDLARPKNSMMIVPKFIRSYENIPELAYRDSLPIGSRGIGRGMHLIPGYMEPIRAIAAYLKG